MTTLIERAALTTDPATAHTLVGMDRGQRPLA